MKFQIAILYLVSTAQIFSDVIIAQTFDLELGENKIWKISIENYKLIEKIEWDNAPKFGMFEAVNKAIKICKENHKNTDIQVNRVSFCQPIKNSERSGIYFYHVVMDIQKNGEFLRSEDLIMDVNGNVIEAVRTVIED